MYFIIKGNLSSVIENKLLEDTPLKHNAIAYMSVI